MLGVRELARRAFTEVSRRAYYPAIDRNKRAPFATALAEAERNQRLSLEDLRAVQLRKLREILAHAHAHTRYYRERFVAARFSPADVRSVADLQGIPELTKDHVFAEREALRSEVFHGKVFHGSTSGSTGIAMRFEHDSLHHAWVDACQWRGRGWWGVRRGDLGLVLWSRPVEGTWWSDTRAWARYRARNTIQFDAFRDFDDARVDRIIDALRDAKPRYVYGYGSSVGRVADGMAARGVALTGEERPLIVEYTADHLYAQERITAESVFGAPVITAYGCSEVGGVAQQCSAGQLHVSIDHVVVEFVRDDGSAARAGEQAHILLTQLHNRAMPLLRYRVGDMGSYSDEPCECGLPLPVMSLAVGKAVDLITTSRHHGVSAHVLDYINLHLIKHAIRGIKQFMVVQTAPDLFEVAFVKETPFRQEAVDTFLAKMREYLGQQIDVRVEFVEQIPLQATGKRRYFMKRFGPPREPIAP